MEHKIKAVNLPSSRPALAPVRQRNHFRDTGRLLLLLEREDLLAAVPPLLLAELKRLGLDLLDREAFGLDALEPQARHKDLLPLGRRAHKELAA